jgi:hypothetical protein
MTAIQFGKSTMKPILRNLRTGLYFQGGVSWTDNAGAALVYNDIEAALDAAYSSAIPGLQLNILLFNDPRYTVRFDLDEFFSKVDGTDMPASLSHPMGENQGEGNCAGCVQPEDDVWVRKLWMPRF